MLSGPTVLPSSTTRRKDTGAELNYYYYVNRANFLCVFTCISGENVSLREEKEWSACSRGSYKKFCSFQRSGSFQRRYCSSRATYSSIKGLMFDILFPKILSTPDII